VVLLLVTGVGLAGLVRCGGEEPPAPAAVRGSATSGKADVALSCEESCGGQAAGGCWCDDSCPSYGDCCPDKTLRCDQPAPALDAAAPCHGVCVWGAHCSDYCPPGASCVKESPDYWRVLGCKP